MKLFLSLWLIATAHNLNAQSYQATVLAHKKESIENPACLSGNCEWTKFSVEATDKRYSFDFLEFPSFRTVHMNRIEFSDPKFNTQYGIVQWIKGCVYQSQKQKDGSIQISYNIGRQFFGKSVHFNHPEWVIDSVDQDPLYWSDPSLPIERNGAYLALRPELDVVDPLWIYLTDAPDSLEIWSYDMPTGGGQRSYGRYINANMFFKTCLYKIDEVPILSTPQGTNIGKAIHCFKWKNSWVYNFETEAYQSPDTLVKFCQRPNKN